MYIFPLPIRYTFQLLPVAISALPSLCETWHTSLFGFSMGHCMGCSTPCIANRCELWIVSIYRHSKICKRDVPVRFAARYQYITVGRHKTSSFYSDLMPVLNLRKCAIRDPHTYAPRCVIREDDYHAGFIHSFGGSVSVLLKLFKQLPVL